MFDKFCFNRRSVTLYVGRITAHFSLEQIIMATLEENRKLTASSHDRPGIYYSYLTRRYRILL